MRRIPLSRRSHVTGFQPLRTGRAEHESALERDFVTLTLFEDADAQIVSQPVTVVFEHFGKMRRYTPDFLVRCGGKPASLIEIKYRDDLREQWPRLRPAFLAARAWATEQDMRFRIVTERAIRGERLNIAKRLLPLRSAPVDADLAAHALAAAGQHPGATFGALAEMMPVSRSAALAVIWRLIARGQLCIDLDAPIGPGTRIAVP